jgi:protein-S-isoprenylcysteine O-methyltransferase
VPTDAEPEDDTSDVFPLDSGGADRSDVPFDGSLLPQGSRSLSLISLQAFGCGGVVVGGLLLTCYLAFATHDSIWRLPAFATALGVFHFLEFYTTARFNLPTARANSFLLYDNGQAYNVAHLSATVEILLSRYVLPQSYARLLVYPPFTIALGLALVLLGQSVRSAAMATAATNFNHQPQRTKAADHVLVTHGVYRWSRHPSYFGFFWWALGTQILVGNKVCVMAYALVLWRFFNQRIKGEFPFALVDTGADSRLAVEERWLVQFFGNEYVQYRKKVGTRIPLIA